MNKTTIINPVIWADVPDVSVIRVGTVYYMVSTSMHSMPGCPIMKSDNLMNWEIVNYVFEMLEDNDAHNLLDGKGIYGQGSWAASLRHHEGVFYVCFSCNDMNRFYVYQTKDIENGPWERSVIPGLHHDPSLLFDEQRARNTLTQRTEGPACTAATLFDVTAMKRGDHAGMVALASQFGTVGVQVGEDGNCHVAMSVKGSDNRDENVERVPYEGSRIYFKIDFNFEDSVDVAHFYYSAEGESWQQIGRPLQMKYTLHHFMGYRIGLFNYAMMESGGYVDIDYFHYAKRG